MTRSSLITFIGRWVFGDGDTAMAAPGRGLRCRVEWGTGSSSPRPRSASETMVRSLVGLAGACRRGFLISVCIFC